MSDSDVTLTRRTALKRVAIGAAAGVAASSGSATATVSSEEFQRIDTQDCTCEYEYKCEPKTCVYEKIYSEYTSYRRECCTCDGETTCEDTWQEYRCCLDTS